MSKKNFLLLTAACLVAAGFFFYLYKDSFKRAVIHISHTIRPRSWAAARRPGNGSDDALVNTIIFRLEGDFKLTAVKVVSIPELATNKYARPVWELVSTSNSMPTRIFSYGQRIRGMHPTVKGSQPRYLTPHVPYRLFVDAGALKGEHDFTVTEDDNLSAR